MSDKAVFILVTGEGVVGLWTMTVMFAFDRFIPRDVFFCAKEETVKAERVIDGTPRRLEILDARGNEHYKCLFDAYVRRSDAIVLVYSITSRQSFENAERMYRDMVDTRVCPARR